METNKSKSFTFFMKLTVFLVIFKLIDISVGGVLHYYTYFNKPNMHELMWKDFYSYDNNTIQVMFLGSSHARFAFDTGYFDEELGTKTFNLSSSGQTPVVGYFALKEALKYQKPKVLVYEAYWRLFGTYDNVTPAYFVFDYIKGYDTKTQMLMELSREKTFSSFLMQSLITSYKYREGITPALKNIISGNIINTSVKVSNNVPFEDFTYYKDGYFGSDKVATEKKLYITNPFKKAGTGFNWNDQQLEYMKKTIDLCKENNIKVLMVTAPMPEPTMSFIKNYEGYSKDLTAIADDMDISYIDYNIENNKAQIFTNDMFYDSNHLNLKGTEKLGTSLAPVIKNFLN